MIYEHLLDLEYRERERARFKKKKQMALLVDSEFFLSHKRNLRQKN